jgi:hypothetical protein
MRWITGFSRFSSAQCSSVAVPSMGACSVASRYILVMLAALAMLTCSTYLLHSLFTIITCVLVLVLWLFC